LQASLCALVAEIKTAEDAYDAAFDAYVAAPQWPRGETAFTGKVAWGEAPEEWIRLGWRPDEPTQGSFEVEVPDPLSYRVIGGARAKDGGLVCCMATKTTPAAPAACPQ
jgi:hypothetical protein